MEEAEGLVVDGVDVEQPESNSAAAVMMAADPAKFLRVVRFIVLFFLGCGA